MDTAIKAPLTERINFRAIAFAGIVLFLLGWPLYKFISETITHGIHNHGDYKEVDLKAMGFFEMNPDTATLKDIPQQYRELDGQKVQLSGEIYDPLTASGRLSEFTLVYSIAKCCFGGPPKVQERVFATVAPGKKVEGGDGTYYDVVGTLHINMKRDPKTNTLIEVYHLDVDSVKPSK